MEINKDNIQDAKDSIARYEKQLKQSDVLRRNLSELTKDQIANCKCDEEKYCKVHQGDCDKHTYLCGDGSCTCWTLSKEDAIELKRQAQIIS